MNKKINLMLLYFLVSFIVAQIATYFLSKENFFTSPTFIILPIVGYFALYLITQPIIKDLKINKIVFLLSFIIFCFLGYYFALFFYNYNIYVILNNMPIRMDFFKMLFESAFFSFIISGAIGILSSK